MKAVHLVLVATLSAAALQVCAQGLSMPRSARAGESAAQAVPFVRAEVEELDAAGGLVTLKHEDIPNLGMPGMTMPFPAVDNGLLQGLKAGDKVRVKIEQVKGTFTITALERDR